MQLFSLTHQQRRVVLPVAVAVVAVVILSLVQAGMALAALLAAIVAGLLVLLVALANVVPAQNTAAHTVDRFTGTAHAEVHPVLLPDGQMLQAQVVELEQPTGHQFVLTKQGYMLVDEAGQVVYRLR
jgi:hypothetical protein